MSAPDTDRQSPAALLAFFALGISWSTVAPLGRLAGNAGVPALVFPFVQALGASIVLGIILLFMRHDPVRRPVPWGLYLVSGTAGHALPQILVFLVIQKLPIGIVGLLISLNPLMTGAIAAMTGTQTLTRRKLIGLLLGLGGAGFAALPGVALPGLSAAPWIGVAMLVPLCFGIANVYSARLRPAGSGAIPNAFGMMMISALVLLIAILASGALYWPDFGALNSGDAALLAHGLIAGLAFFLFFTVLETGGPIMVAAASYIILILSSVWGWVFFSELPGPGYIAAAALVMAGLYLTIKAPSARRRA